MDQQNKFQETELMSQEMDQLTDRLNKISNASIRLYWILGILSILFSSLIFTAVALLGILLLIALVMAIIAVMINVEPKKRALKQDIKEAGKIIIEADISYKFERPARAYSDYIFVLGNKEFSVDITNYTRFHEGDKIILHASKHANLVFTVHKAKSMSVYIRDPDNNLLE